MDRSGSHTVRDARAPAGAGEPAGTGDTPAGAGDTSAGAGDTPAGAEEAGEAARFGRFFLPGPVEVHPEVLAAMERPVIGHRSDAMVRLMEELQPGLRELFGTERPVWISTSSATGLMEGVISNLCGRRALCLVCGAFGRRFAEIADRLGRPADRLEVEWGRPNLPDRLHDRLTDRPGRYDLVTVVHSETSTGVLNPVEEIAAVVRSVDDVLLAVDGVSSVAGAEVRADDWGVDFYLTGSQKALALPPGLAFGVASERALDRAESVEARSHYFDFVDFQRRVRKGQTPNTPAVSLLFALRAQLDRIAREGVEARWSRHGEMAALVHEWVEGRARRTGMPFRVLAPEGFRSPTVTAVELPPGRSGPGVAASLKERGYTIAPGYGKLKERTVRIGHMGDHTVSQLESLLAALDDALEG